MFDPDLFISWMASQRSGSLASLVRDAAWASGRDRKSATRWIGRLEALSLVTVDWDRAQWSARTCEITDLPGGIQTAVLTGTRSVGLALCRQLGAVVERPQPAEAGMPLPATVWFQYSESSQLHGLAASLGAQVTPCAAEALARSLTPFKPGPATAPPESRSSVEKLDPTTAEFTGVHLSRHRPTPGLYKYTLYGRLPRYLLLRRTPRQTPHHQHAGSGTWHAVGRREGTHYVLPATAFPLQWEPYPEATPHGRKTLGRLTANWRAPLPLTQERAAVLCTGLAGTRTKQGDRYDGIPLHIAERIAVSLRRRLETS